VVGLFVALRVPAEQEMTGLDLALHGESAYNFLEPGISSAPVSQKRPDVGIHTMASESSAGI